MTTTFAAILVVRSGQLVLAVCDPDGRPTGYPGGKLESGETPLAAAVRECTEETGLQVHTSPAALYSAEVNGRLCEAFVIDIRYTTGTLQAEVGRTLRWVTPDDVAISQACRHPEYDRGVAAALREVQQCPM